MIPLRDANPTRRTPIVTIDLAVTCLVVFAWEPGLQVSGGDEALEAFIATLGRSPTSGASLPASSQPASCWRSVDAAAEWDRLP